jgi:hypothetical protein
VVGQQGDGAEGQEDKDDKDGEISPQREEGANPEGSEDCDPTAKRNGDVREADDGTTGTEREPGEYAERICRAGRRGVEGMVLSG